MKLTSHVILLALASLMSGLVSGRFLGSDELEEEFKGPIDEIIRKASNSSKSFDFFWDEGKHVVLFEGDMLIRQDEWLAAHSPNRVKRTAGIIPTPRADRWSNKVVKYSIQFDDFNRPQLEEINKAFASWEHYTCVKFEQAGPKDVNRVLIQNGGGCYSYVGMIGGTQELGLAAGCRYKDIVIHELGHALGLHHEQTRPDRNKYVTIMSENMAAGVEVNFERMTWKEIQRMGISYDYYSIMHYSAKAFSTNGKPTVVTTNEKFQDIIGNSKDLSFKDIKTMNLMYSCNVQCKPIECPKGFQGPDCECWCPVSKNPFSVTYCDAETLAKGDIGKPGPRVVPSPLPTSSCYNDPEFDGLCPVWADEGRCDNDYVKVWCKRTCAMCF